MKVCYIVPQSATMVAGGPLVQAQRTADELRKLGVEVAQFNPWERYPDEAFDLYHIFVADYLTYDIAVRLREYGRRYVVSSIFYTLRSPRFVRFAERVERVAQRTFAGVWTNYGMAGGVCRGAAAVLPNTQDEARLVREGFGVPAERVRVVPNGVESRFADATPELFRSTTGLAEPFVLNVGHVGSWRKNVLALIRALADVQVPGVIIGQVQNNRYAAQCLREAERNPRLQIIPGLSNDDPLLASAYAACHAFVLPSHFETPGIAALEAGLAGARIAITPHGGTRDYFDEGAVYINPRSVQSIRHGIEEVLRQPKDDVLRKRIESRYLWRHVAERTLEAYRAALNMS